MTVDLKLHRAAITSRSAAARLLQLAASAPDEATAQILTEEAQVLRDTADQLEKRLQSVLEQEPGYPLAEKAGR